MTITWAPFCYLVFSFVAEAPHPNREEHHREPQQHGRLGQERRSGPARAGPGRACPAWPSWWAEILTAVWTKAGNSSIGYQQPPSSAITMPSMMLNPLACSGR